MKNYSTYIFYIPFCIDIKDEISNRQMELMSYSAIPIYRRGEVCDNCTPLASGSDGPMLVAMAQCNVELHFNVVCDGTIPDCNSLLRWVKLFQRGNQWAVPAQRRCHKMLTVPQCSVKHCAPTLGLSLRSLQRIRHCELKFFPSKIMIDQKLSLDDYVQQTVL
ncbi:hypothetical protein PR048_009385 [Dryococelus australis]|uniref:SOCS box domain-containing protein n=1 Tax=Dryococelus australis TaxID=614101 RepID=A0ABQ9HZP6_9NEOP|nr:hypothetical protein PR048_009385 [Dryococelus australis]